MGEFNASLKPTANAIRMFTGYRVYSYITNVFRLLGIFVGTLIVSLFGLSDTRICMGMKQFRKLVGRYRLIDKTIGSNDPVFLFKLSYTTLPSQHNHKLIAIGS